MAKKLMSWKTKGMNRDLSVSAFNPEFAFENMNLRLSTNDGNTALSWVSEKGTKPITILNNNAEFTIRGTVVGTAVLNEFLIIFSHYSDTKDYIYRLEQVPNQQAMMRATKLFEGKLNLSVKYPLETAVSYETEDIQKVYWIDNNNQPRVINIAPSNDVKIPEHTSTSFDFIPTLKLKEKVSIKKILGASGMFAPGVIQYAFTYYNNHLQESNIFYTTPLCYISHKDRGGSPEDKVDNAFNITVKNVDGAFDYLRIYSIHRTSIDAEPLCKRVQDIEIASLDYTLIDPNGPDELANRVYTASFTDRGISGNSIDPMELLYKGGRGIKVGTMEQKDNTLFFGDITTIGTDDSGVEQEDVLLSSEEEDTRSFVPLKVSDSNYKYSSQLNAVDSNKNSIPVAGFKRGDTYRCGVQFQDSMGRWSDPVFIKDQEIKGIPSTSEKTDPMPETTENIFNTQLTLETCMDIFSDIASGISNNNEVRWYLRDMFNEAKREYELPEPDLFHENRFPHVYDYHGTNAKYETLSYNAMQTWLMAICLSELMPSKASESVYINSQTNNQTEFFKRAYEICGGNSIGLYGGTEEKDYYTIKGDPMIARLVASAVYSRVRGGAKYTYEKISEIRHSLTGNTDGIEYTITDWSGLGYMNASQNVNSGDAPMTQLGWLVNASKFIPRAPGPFLKNNTNTEYTDGPRELLYDASDDTYDWYPYNYQMDVKIDEIICEDYRLFTEENEHYVFHTPVGILEKRVNQRILEAAAMPEGTGFVFFGKKKVKYIGSEETYQNIPAYFSPRKQWNPIKLKFEETTDAITENNDVYEIAGPFSNMQGVMFRLRPESSVIVYDETEHMRFLHKVLDIAGNSIFPITQNSYGRRAPLAGLKYNTARYEEWEVIDNTTYVNGQTNPLNGLEVVDLACMFTTTADYELISKLSSMVEAFPHSKPDAYPSRYAAQAWTLAMYLSQIDPSRIGDYMEKAYQFGVNSAIGRYSWNSDLIYGRLIGTMALPIINAMRGLYSDYCKLRNAYNDTREPAQKKSVTFDLTNGSSAAIEIGNTLELTLVNPDLKGFRYGAADDENPQEGPDTKTYNNIQIRLFSEAKRELSPYEVLSVEIDWGIETHIYDSWDDNVYKGEDEVGLIGRSIMSEDDIEELTDWGEIPRKNIRICDSDGNWNTINASLSLLPNVPFEEGMIYQINLSPEVRQASTRGEVKAVARAKSTGTQELSDTIFNVPVIKGYLKKDVVDNLKRLGYCKVRPVVVFPNIQDRHIVCQGVVCPTVYTNNQRGIGDANEATRNLYAQSSWFFRPFYEDQSIGLLNYPKTENSENIRYQDSYRTLRQVEIEGNFSDGNKFKVDWDTLTMHSPELEFDTSMMSLDYTAENLSYSYLGKAVFKRTFSDIDIQTETPPIKGAGFLRKSMAGNYAKGIISGLFYDDYVVDDNVRKVGDDETEDVFEAYSEEGYSSKWLVYPWNCNGSLNNDITRPANTGVRSAVLKKKIISNLRYSDTIQKDTDYYDEMHYLTHLYSSDVAEILKLQRNEGEEESISDIYQGNIDTLLSPDTEFGKWFSYSRDYETTKFEDSIRYRTARLTSNHFGIFMKIDDGHDLPIDENDVGDNFVDLVSKKENVRMQYRSTPHLVLKRKLDSPALVRQGSSNEDERCYLPIFELKRDLTGINIFGGTSMDALKENMWIPCGEPVRLDDSSAMSTIYTKTDSVTQKESIVPEDTENATAQQVLQFEYSYGDTYYQRWDCLKTYCYTPEDSNQVVEIGSFMLETHVNIDGRYDRNRGQMSNLYMSPINFNLINPVYSQIDNFFTYRIKSAEDRGEKRYPNQITWSMAKNSGEEIDKWTNITLASALEMDGDKGAVRKLVRFNNEIICLQDKGVSQVLYNDNVQISSTNGVPIELANSGKVQGKRYYSDSIGCSNKWSVAQTPSGVYFMDANNKAIFLFNGQLSNLSGSNGFNTWAQTSIPDHSKNWTPGLDRGDFDNFVAYYDKKNQDVLFISKTQALAFSERFGTFTSFYNYENTPYLCNLADAGIWIKNTKDSNDDYITTLWSHNGGEYCKFFGVSRPYWTTLVCNPEPQTDKIFTNMEFRASVQGDNKLPFDSLEAWNEYQHGYTTLKNLTGHPQFQHHVGEDSSLRRKFRIWRCDIPRNNCLLDSSNQETPYSKDAELGISRLQRKPLDRMRNLWLYLKLKKGETESLGKTEVHDIIAMYFS